MAVNSHSDRELMWLVIIHVVFVVSSVLLALSDRIADNKHEKKAVVEAAKDASGSSGASGSGSGNGHVTNH